MGYEKLNLKNGEDKWAAEHVEHLEFGILANETALSKKQDALKSGTNIKTINGQPILGEGNLEIEGGASAELATASGKTLIVSDAKSKPPVELTATGYTEVFGKSKNLFDPVKAAELSNYAKVTISGVEINGLTFQLKPNTTYTMSRVKIEGLSSYANINFGTASARQSLLNNESRSITTLDDGLLYFGPTGDAAGATAYLEQYTNIQLEEGSVATTYEPFSDKEGVINAGNLDEATGKYACAITFKGMTKTATATVVLDKPLSKWDYICKKDGVWGVSYNSETIDSYNGENITGEFASITGELVNGQPVQYKTDKETFVAFDSETAAQFEALTFDGITELSTDCELTLDVTYEVGSSEVLKNHYVSVKDYGAVGDGETNDTEAIRAARDIAVLLKKPLYFPAGTYLLSNTIQLFSDMHIIGAKGAKLTKYAAVTQNLTEAGVVGATSVKVSDASQFTVGRDIYIGAAGISGSYQDTVGYITEIDTDTNTIHFKVYPRHSLDANAGLNRAVDTAGIVSSTFSMLCTFSVEDAGGNIRIEGLEFDGNKQSGEAQMYSLSPINIDPNKLNVTVRDCKVVNSPADGISLQNNGQTTVDNCIVEKPTYHGIHPGYSINGVSITNCFIYDCPNSGVYDCYNVNGMTVSNCYIVNCYLGVGGLDEHSNGSNIVGCTFENCQTGVKLGATNGGASVVGCSFQSCKLALDAYVGGTATVKGCVFMGCTNVLQMRRAREILFSGNIIKECTAPIICGVQPSQPTLRSNNIIIEGNIAISSESGKTSAFDINNMDNALIRNNMLIGNGATITVDKGTTSGIVTEGNIGTVV